MDREHCHLLRGVTDGRAELHHDGSGFASEGHDHDAHAPHGLVLVRDRDPGASVVWRSALGGNLAAAGSQSWHQLLCSARGREWPNHGSKVRFALAVASPILVL